MRKGIKTQTQQYKQVYAHKFENFDEMETFKEK